MFDQNNIADDFSLVASDYGKRATLQARVGEALIAVATPHIVPNALLLDVGAGSGEITKRWPVSTAIALDLSVGMCEEARAKGLATFNASATQLPVRDAAVDVVASNAMLQWIPQPERFFAESHRVLKTGGILAISHFAQGTLTELAKAFAEAGQGARVSDFHAPTTITRQIQAAGFEVLSNCTEILTEKYYGVMQLCGFIRDIGAANKRADRPRGLLTPRALRKVTEYYPREGLYITASWVVQRVIARKTGLYRESIGC